MPQEKLTIKKDTIKKDTIFKLHYNFIDSEEYITVKALHDIAIHDLNEALSLHRKAVVSNSYTYCLHGTEDDNCKNHNSFPYDFDYCPYCGSVLELQIVPPTIQQFLQYYSHHIEQVELTSIYTDYND